MRDMAYTAFAMLIGSAIIVGGASAYLIGHFMLPAG